MRCTFGDVYDMVVEQADEELDIISVARNINACLRFDLNLCMFLPTEATLTRDAKGNFNLPENFKTSDFCKIKEDRKLKPTIFENYGDYYFHSDILPDTINVIYNRLPDIVPEDVKMEDNIDLEDIYAKIPALYCLFSFDMVEEEYGGDTERYPNEKGYYEELKSSFCAQMRKNRAAFLNAWGKADYMTLERIMGARLNERKI